MQTWLIAAGVLAFVVGAIHSVLGEVLIFRHLRNKGLVPTVATPPLRERHVRILWATWHIVTVFGWAFSAILLWLAFAPNDVGFVLFVKDTIILSTLVSAFLVLIGTKGMHPGWLGLLGIAVFTWLS
jgi:hypothetical protein